MHEYLDYLDKRERDFEKNKKRYFKKISEIAEKHGGKAYIFGSYVKGESLPGSDIDILVIIPKEANRIKVLNELRMEIPNTKFEFHVLHEEEGKYFLRKLDKKEKL